MFHESLIHLADQRSASVAPRSVVIACSDRSTRSRLRQVLEEMRWSVRETGGAAETIIEVERIVPEALVVDTWLPDLELSEFVVLLQNTHPALEIIRVDGVALHKGAKAQRRQELMACLRDLEPAFPGSGAPGRQPVHKEVSRGQAGSIAQHETETAQAALGALVGSSRPVQELIEVIRLVAPCDTTVLIEGETGTGKELVAHALHACSARSSRPLVILNCAAIPETLLEAELFGHARGAFTGAVQSRTGRIEAADGGTLFLDEIGEMPLALQAKMLRFLECGELQRIGDNSVSRVDVRVVAATHQHLEQRAEEGTFRLDLYHRLAVFPIDVAPLRDRMVDIPSLLEHILDRLSSRIPAGHGGRKSISADALDELLAHRWPGNIRELKHVIERAVILSGDSTSIDRDHIRIRRRPR